MRASVSEPVHQNRLDSLRQSPRAIVTYFVRVEVELGDRWACLVVFWAMVTVPEPRQPRGPHDCTEEIDGALHTQQSVQVTKCVSWRTARMKHPVGTTAGG